MTVTVGLYDAGYTRLKDRIDAMGLDIEIRAFDEDGNFDIGEGKVPAADAEIDYLWLGPDLAGGSLGSLPFDLALACKRIDVLQTFNAGLDNPAYKKLSDKGIRICNSSAQSVAIAEYSVARLHHQPIKAIVRSAFHQTQTHGTDPSMLLSQRGPAA